LDRDGTPAGEHDGPEWGAEPEPFDVIGMWAEIERQLCETMHEWPEEHRPDFVDQCLLWALGMTGDDRGDVAD
jgi:hypothetical protein